MALTSEQWKSLEDMAQQIGRETIANGLGSPQAQGTGSPAYSENASPRERYNQLWEIRKQQAAEAAESAEQREERRERVRSNFLTTMNQVQEKQSRTNEASATPVPGSVQAQNLEFLSQYQQENSLLARLKKTGQAAVSGIKDAVASNTDAQRALYEAGQSGREAQMEEEVKALQYSLDEARRAYGQLKDAVAAGEKGFTEKDVQDKADQIKQLEVQISAYKKAPEAQRGAAEETSKLADEVKKSAEADIERAKKGRGKLGSFFMDAVAGGTQLLGDIGAGAITGGGAMPSLALRSFGGGTQQARQAGASLGQQIGFGAATATVEMLTEKMADGLAGAFEKGAADDVAEEVMRRLASTPTGQTALRTLYSMGSEGVEEVVSEIVSPALKAIYGKGESAKESYGTKEGRKALAADALYSGLLGAAFGASGSAVNIATGRDAQTNARNQELSDIYKEIGTPGIKQAVKDRGILENIKGGKDYGNLSIGDQANEAMEALRGRTPESVRAGQLAGARNRLFEIQQQRAAEAKAARQNATPPAQPAAAQEPTTKNPLYEALRPRTKPVAESATTSQTPENAHQTQEAPTGEITPLTAQNAQSEARAQPQTAETAQERLERAQARYDEIDRLFDSNEVSDEDVPGLVAEMEERYNEIQALTPLAERERKNAADAQTQRQRVEAGEVSKGYGTAENHIDRRTPESVAKTGVKSFQFDHPQLHDYYVEAAQALKDEVQAAEAADYERKVNKNTQRKTGSAIKGPVRRLMDLGLTKPQILKCLEDIISDNGQENYAAAKKVELVLNDMLTNGWTSTRGRKNYHEPNAAYVSAKDAIGGGIKADSWEKYLAQNELSLIDGTVTEEQLRQEWEQMHPQEAATAEKAETAPKASRPVETESAGTEQSARTIPASEQTTAERTNGTDERGYTGQLVDTQDRVFETQLTDEEKQIPGLTAEEARHIQHHDAEVDIRAKERIAAGVNQARADLLAAESWSDEDTATAGYIIQAELEAAEKAGSVEERAAIYKRLAELKKQWNKQGTEQGRALRQRQRFVAEDMVSAAADILYSDKSGKNEKALRKLNPQAKDAIMGKVREYAKRFNDMQKSGGTVGDLIQLIKDVSVQRRTTGLFSRENGRAVDFALSEVAKQDGGVDFLKELATTQIKSIASDYLKPGIIDQIKSWRFMAMLSNAATTTANAGSNFVFGSFMEALSGNLALPFDMLMSQVTGQREVAGELGAFSKTKWQGSYDAMLRSFLEVTLDAETAQADYGYKELKGGAFKMVGNPLERLLATMQKYQGYALKTTDQAAKGGTEAQVRKGLGKLAERGKAKAENIDALADQEAKYRTLQTDGKVSKAVNTVRGAFDEALHIGNEKTGKYGIASDIMPFAQVPANAVAVTLESNPAIGAVKALVETAKVLSDGKDVEPGQQAKAARAWGRVANGASVAATFAALAAKGYLRDEDDENKDIAAQRKAEGRSGVQLNISALLRGDPSEREDDLWIDFSWIPPLNGLANFGVDIYRAYTEDGHISLKDISLASGEALASAFMDFPAVSKISSMIKTYQNSEAEGVVGKGLETIATGAAQTASSILVPNAVRAAAAGLDPYERDVYNTDTYGEGIKNNLISGIPGLRETLPERLDTFGQPVKNEGGALHFLDKTLIPGNVSQHNRQSAASKYVEDLIAKTGDKKLQPSRYPPYKTTLGDGDNKQSVELTAAERREYQQTRGNAIAEMTQELAESRAMRGATDGQKALFSAIKNAANHAAEAELAESRGIEQDPTQINGKDFMAFAEMGAPESVLDRLAENGMTGEGRNTLWEIMRGSGKSPSEFAVTAAQIVNEKGNASQERVFEALRGKDYTAEEKQRIWDAYGNNWKTSYSDYAAKNGGDESKATKSSGNALYDYYAERMKKAK